MVTCLPASTAVSEPDPATVDIMVTSMGTGVRRALNVSLLDAFCGLAACANSRTAVPMNIPGIAHPRLIVMDFLSTQTLQSKFSVSIISAGFNRSPHAVPTRADHTRAAIPAQARGTTMKRLSPISVRHVASRLALLDFIPDHSESSIHGVHEFSVWRSEEQGRDERQVQDQDASHGRTWREE